MIPKFAILNTYLLLQTFSCILIEETMASRALKEILNLPPGIIQDLYHCINSAENDDDTVNCDAFNYTWNITDLSEGQMPYRCIGMNFTVDDIKNDNDDYYEPCILWHMLYGQLSEFSPSSAPSTSNRKYFSIMKNEKNQPQ
jgi:hypothetical protein